MILIAVTGVAISEVDGLRSALVFLSIAGLIWGAWLVIP
jgi:hypothetical protein